MQNYTPLFVSGLIVLTSACGGASTTNRQMMEPVQFRDLDAATAQLIAQGTLELIQEDVVSQGVLINGAMLDTTPVNDPDLGGDLFSYSESRDDNDEITSALGSEVAAVVGTTGTDTGFLGGLAFRTGGATLPLSGSGTFTGEHRSMVSRQVAGDGDAFNNVEYFILSDATLDVDFANGTVSGQITDRDVVARDMYLRLMDNSSATNVTLAETELSSTGTFSGTTTGGNLTLNGETYGLTGMSNFTGLVGGTEGSFVAGVTQTAHTSLDVFPPTGEVVMEVGAFAALADN